MAAQDKFQPRILLVDDEECFVRILSLLLKRRGLTNVTACLAASEVDAMFQEIQPDLVLLDCHMPGHLRGPDLLERIRERDPRVPVVMVTASSDPRLLQECRQKGASGILPKPFEPAALGLIETLLARKE